ncbi:Retrotransposon protein, Ty3-gypsy subclass [Phytophthora cinnamomi]|uniref:Retrotransposon protein, Ty3-gypsy subclass n=1 Tax=Phytophthora cinnamomi TaxID=4785 RepID=UPI00355AB8AE|nr:Retrotransposon protein, Ty3-gypsy subclass [Phytophthora cinnamomi]
MQEVFGDMMNHNLLVYVDDVVLYAPTHGEFLVVLEKFFQRLRESNLKLNVSKSELYAQAVTWCGKIVDGSGVMHDPSRVNALQILPLQPMQEKSDEVMTGHNRKKRHAVSVAVTWTSAEEQAYKAFLDRLASSVTLSFPDDDATAHRGEQVMIAHLQDKYGIERLQSHVKNFVSKCLLCKHLKGGKLIQRPWSQPRSVPMRNEVLHMDYLSMDDSYGPTKYVLVLKDELTHFCELIPCDSPTSTVAATAMLDCFRGQCGDLTVKPDHQVQRTKCDSAGTRTKNGKVIECVVDALRHKQAMKKAGDEVSEVAERAVCGPTALREKMREDDATRVSVCVYACAAEVWQAQVRVVKAMASVAEQRRDSRMKLEGAQGDHEQVGSDVV